MRIVSIQQIEKQNIKSFRSGNKQLDLYFHCFAFQNDVDGLGKTFVYLDEGVVKGFVTLTSSEIQFASMPEEYRNKAPKYPLPSIKIARLAVDEQFQHQGVGRELIKEALKRSVLASINVGVKLVVVDAKDEAKGFYEKFGFSKVLDSENLYFIPMQVLLKAIMK